MTPDKATFAEAALEAALLIAGEDAAVEAFRAAEAQLDARLDRTFIADSASAFITADNAVSMLAASVLIAADTDAMSALITVERAVFAEAALEAAFESAGLDVAVEALNAAETQFEARFDRTFIADVMSVFIAALTDAISVLMTADTEVKSALRTTLVLAR